MIYDVIDDVLPENVNSYITSVIRHVRDGIPAIPETEDARSHGDGGMVLPSYPNESNDPVLEKLNLFGEIISESVFAAHKKKGRFNNIEVDRFMYNYYTRSSECFHHYDDNKTVQQAGQSLASFIYCLNDNDGYNIVNDQKIESKSGRCIIFSSSDYHSAVGPKEYATRFTLNCTFKYSGYNADWVRQLQNET